MPLTAWISLIITIIAAILLISERLRSDLIALMVLVTLGLTNLVTPAEAFAGFSGSAVTTILAISIISEGLKQTGATTRLGRLLQRWGGKSEGRLIIVTMLISAFLSLFMNNIAAVGVLLPAIMSLCRFSGISPSRLLMPLAYGTTLGGMATLLTTSNIIISGTLKEAGFASLGLLDFLPIGIPIIIVGVLYMILIGRHGLPKSTPKDNLIGTQELRTRLSRMYGIQKNLCELSVLPTSPLADQNLRDGAWGKTLDLNVLGYIHSGQLYLAPDSSEVICSGDLVLAQGKPDSSLLNEYGLVLLNPPNTPAFTDEATTLAEIVLSPHTSLTGKTLREFNFREKYRLNVLAIWRSGRALRSEFVDLPLQGSDALLVQGTLSQLRVLNKDNDFIVLEEDPDAAINPRKSILAASITFLTLGFASIGWLPVSYVALAGAVLMLLTGCLTMNDTYRSIEWKTIFLIAGMWPLSTAIRSSGLASAGITGLLSTLSITEPLILAAILIFISLLVTQFMGGQVAALVLAPLALAAAHSTSADPRAMGMAVALGCSLAFPTPFGHPVNLMVMSPGSYRVKNYLVVGIPLTILVFLTILAGLKYFWGL